MKGWQAWGISASIAIDQAAAAMYYAASRAYFSDRLGEESYRFMLLLSAAEALPGIAGPLLGLLGDVRGARTLLLLSSLRGFLLPLIVYTPSMGAVGLVALVGLLSTLFSAAAVGSLLRASGGSAARYAKLSILFPIAWAVGGLIPAPVVERFGYPQLFLLMGALYSLSSLLGALFAENSFGNGKVGAALRALPLRPLLGLALFSAGLTLFFSMIAVKLYRELGNDLLLFGFVGVSLTSLLSALARPLAGLVVEKVGEERALLLVVIAYSLYGISLYLAGGFLLALLWLLPFYPFKDVAQAVYVSRRLPMELQATAAGILTMIYSLSSVANLIAYPVLEEESLGRGLLIMLLLSLISFLLIRSGGASPRGGSS
ncbi:MAG: MFS transporter [Acidilobaceae archaeon]|nr:MFS transporter [Acidilobaceae archaeon]MCX8165294.1 MFS transporter [Acidilobaceae archaeon]MDW7973720.1 MFS transporter [Sulfolobales archaeon]